MDQCAIGFLEIIEKCVNYFSTISKKEKKIISFTIAHDFPFKNPFKLSKCDITVL